jgi:hypothetical protein
VGTERLLLAVEKSSWRNITITSIDMHPTGRIDPRMRFYTKDECEDWLGGRGRAKPDAIPEIHRAHVHYPTSPGRILYLAHWVAGSLMYRDPALVWIAEWGIWGSSENWHLYYKLRQSYGDLRLLHEAPGHLFLGHESEDLTSFLQVAMLNGWGGYILTQADYVNAFFSHDEYIDFFAAQGGLGVLDDIRKEFGTVEHPPKEV